MFFSAYSTRKNNTKQSITIYVLLDKEWEMNRPDLKHALFFLYCASTQNERATEIKTSHE